jgi:acylphosphatase
LAWVSIVRAGRVEVLKVGVDDDVADFDTEDRNSFRQSGTLCNVEKVERKASKPWAWILAVNMGKGKW